MKRRDKHQWMLDRINDPYFIKAKKEGYRARSAYKLLEMHRVFSIIPKKGCVLDLGCAPGAWLQVLKKNTKAFIYGVDLLNIEPIIGVNFLKGNIFDQATDVFLSNKKFSLILSDLSPNCMGIKDIDHFRIIMLAKRVFELVLRFLHAGGDFCIKLFDGAQLNEYRSLVGPYFKSIKIFKPKSSYLGSQELYLVCKSFIVK